MKFPPCSAGGTQTRCGGPARVKEEGGSDHPETARERRARGGASRELNPRPTSSEQPHFYQRVSPKPRTQGPFKAGLWSRAALGLAHLGGQRAWIPLSS